MMAEPLKYGDKLIRMEGIITEVHDGAVAIDLKGRLGSMRIPLRMLITDYELRPGQEVAWNMSFIEQLSPKVNETYIRNQEQSSIRQTEIQRIYEQDKEERK